MIFEKDKSRITQNCLITAATTQLVGSQKTRKYQENGTIWQAGKKGFVTTCFHKLFNIKQLRAK